MKTFVKKLTITDDMNVPCFYLFTLFCLFNAYFHYDSLSGTDKAITNFIWSCGFNAYFIFPVLINGYIATWKYVDAINKGKVPSHDPLGSVVGTYAFFSNWLVLFVIVPIITFALSYYFGYSFPLYFLR